MLIRKKTIVAQNQPGFAAPLEHLKLASTFGDGFSYKPILYQGLSRFLLVS